MKLTLQDTNLHNEKLPILKRSLLSSRVPQVRFCPCKGRKSLTLAVRVKLSKEKYPLTSTTEVTCTVALKRSGLVLIVNGVTSSSSNLPAHCHLCTTQISSLWCSCYMLKLCSLETLPLRAQDLKYWMKAVDLHGLKKQ